MSHRRFEEIHSVLGGAVPLSPLRVSARWEVRVTLVTQTSLSSVAAFRPCSILWAIENVAAVRRDL